MTKKRNFQLDHCGGTGSFSIFSRAAGGPDTFTDDDRDEFRRLLRANEEFGGVRIVAWTVVSNYFRMLVEIPGQDPPDEAEMKARCRVMHTVRRLFQPFSVPNEP